MRISMMAACAALAMLPGLALAQSPTTGSTAKSGTAEPKGAGAKSEDHAPMQGAGSVGESSATNGKTDNSGGAGHTGK